MAHKHEKRHKSNEMRYLCGAVVIILRNVQAVENVFDRGVRNIVLLYLFIIVT